MENWELSKRIDRLDNSRRQMALTLARLENGLGASRNALVMQAEQIKTLQDKLNATVAGEQKTGNATTPTCGSGGQESLPRENRMGPPEPGLPCPTCGKMVGMTSAQRQAKFRAMKGVD